ncbi:MAG: tetratricopeptide (TPR) repeat protein [Polyangiales bacterium]|jgi:tetratricopeptide (TPR) repeat protein
MVGCDVPTVTKAPPEPEPVPDVVETIEAPPIFDEGPSRLPTAPAQSAPSHATWRGDTSLLSDTVTCASCHQDVAASWAQSAHARSSFDNPWYRVAVDAFRAERGNEASRFCAGCHDPVLLVEGAIDEDIEGDDLRAHAGIPCLVCHSTTETRADGNGSFSLDLSPVPIPDPDDAAQVAEHVARVTPSPLRTAALCGSCHRSFIGPEVGSLHHMAGIDDIGAWRQSAFSGADGERHDDVEEASCASCHMELIDAPRDLAASEGQVHSHRVLASHTALPGGEEGHLLAGAASIDVAALRVGRRWHYSLGEAGRGSEYTFDVVVRNEEAGHRFPGGTRDLQDTWVEVSVFDEDGELLAQAGARHATEPDSSAYRFRSVVMDAEGRPEPDHLVHHFVAAAYDRTIAPRDAALIRYSLRTRRRPARIRARILHRKHSTRLRLLACEASRTPRGRAFDAMTRELEREPIDACAPEPITLVAEVERCLGEGCDDAPTYPRLRNLALARSHSLQERLDEVRPVVAAARRFGEHDAELNVILARVAGRQGRVDEAIELLEDDTSVSAARARGRAYAQVWRWAEAAEAYEDVARRSPRDPRALTDLAQALGSIESPNAAAAARAGLRFGPRVESLLRTQSLARDDDEAAREAYFAHRAPDEAPALLRRCEELDEECARDRQPIPIIELTSP